MDFDKPSNKHRKKPKKTKPKSDNIRSTTAAGASAPTTAADDDIDDDEDEEDDDADEEGGGGGGGRKRGCDADSAGSPKTPAQTPTSADPDAETEPGSASKRSCSSGKAGGGGGGVKQPKLSSSAKLLLDKKRLEQYIEEGEVLVPVPRARRRLKGGDLGYMVKKGDTVVRYIDKDGIIYNPTGEPDYFLYYPPPLFL